MIIFKGVNMADINEIRKVLMEVVKEYSDIGPGYFQQRGVIKEAGERLNLRGIEEQQALLTLWGDLFRSGILWWGHDIANAELPFLHLTNKGKKVLENLSRDPSNPEGYLEYISGFNINAVANSYVIEALETYNNNCFKAAAVMIGAASESIILELRDNMISKIKSKGESVPSKLNDKRISTVINRISSEIESNKSKMPSELYDSFNIYWSSFIGHIRVSRNDAGHPKSISPVEEETIHSSLLIYPNLVKLVNELNEWITKEY